MKSIAYSSTNRNYSGAGTGFSSVSDNANGKGADLAFIYIWNGQYQAYSAQGPLSGNFKGAACQ